MGQHSIGADNHTWVLRDDFVDDHSRIDRSVVSKAQGNNRRVTRTGGGLIWNHRNNDQERSA
jgi:hypothetical protein